METAQTDNIRDQRINTTQSTDEYLIDQVAGQIKQLDPSIASEQLIPVTAQTPLTSQELKSSGAEILGEEPKMGFEGLHIAKSLAKDVKRPLIGEGFVETGKSFLGKLILKIRLKQKAGAEGEVSEV